MKVYIQGSGMEVCVAKLSEEDVKKFKDNEDDIDISKIMGKEWPELHDVFYYAGPNSDYLSLEDEEGESIEIQGSDDAEKLFNDVDDQWNGTLMKDMSVRYMLISVTDEKGCFGTLLIENDWDPSKLSIGACAPEFGMQEFCIVQGYVYDGKIIDVSDEEAGTETFSVEHIVYDLETEAELLKF